MERCVASEPHLFGRLYCDYSRTCKRRPDVTTADGNYQYLNLQEQTSQYQIDRSTQNWHDFTTTFWLNGTPDVYWPTKLTSAHVGGPQCRGVLGLTTIQCVAKGLADLENYFEYFPADTAYEITTPESEFPRILEAVPRYPEMSAEAWSVAPHAATSLIKK